MPTLTRRQFLAASAAGAATLTAPRAFAASPARRFTLDLTPGAVGISGELPEIIRLAQAHGFESVQPDSGWLAGQDAEGRRRLRAALDEAKLKWGAAGLPVEFRQSEEAFQKDLGALPQAAAALQAAGATRVGTWLMPGHNELEFAANLERHAKRLREVAGILRDHDLRLGLEYVGTPSLRARFKHPFVHNLAGARELVAAIGVPGTGFVPDSWHWWAAGDTAAALRELKNEEIVAVDLNDAPAGVPLAEQQDGRRELPAATGVIPVKEFLTVLLELGYDGPVRAEPFNAPLNALDNEAAAAQVIAALRKAVARAGG
ncbi:MAG: sugar phosphate isomerase/epimerase family protein [Limisphaerales bacterium]